MCGAATTRIGPDLFGWPYCVWCCACSRCSFRVLERRIDDQISPKRFWRDLSFVLVAPWLPSRFLLTTCVLLSSFLPWVLVLPFCALLLTAGTSKSLRRFGGPFCSSYSFMTMDHLVFLPLPVLCALSRRHGCHLLSCLRVVMTVLAFVLHILIMCFIFFT